MKSMTQSGCIFHGLRASGDVILCSLGNPFFIEVKSGIESALQELSSIGVTGSIIEIKGFDEKKELCALDQAAEEHVDGIVITPVNSRAISEKLEKLKEQGIEIVTINSDIHKPEKLAYVGCDYVASGDVGGKLIGIMSNGLTEHIAVIIGSMKVKAQAERLFGIKQVLKKHYPNDVIDSVIENEDDDQICFDRLDSLLAANHDISVICFAAAGVAGGLKAIEKYEKKRKLKVITYDLTDIVKKNLQNERIVASVCQEPYRQGV
jgi:LacI family transcriptional regulator